MPCIKTNNNDKFYAPVSYCGKTIHFPTPFFKDTIDAYRDDKPICPKCRKILGLEKKTIKKKITSISLLDTTMTIHYNDKSKIIKNVNFSDTVGFYINDLNDIDNDDIHKIKDYLKSKQKIM